MLRFRMRVLGVDFGLRRIGLAVSDHSRTLARPWRAIEAGATPGASAEAVNGALAAWRASGDDTAEVDAIVVGLPKRLGGEDTDQTGLVRQFAAALERVSGLPVHLQDERLTSREAESRLAMREKDWRRRKAKLDAASAAIILQDYLDRA
jgi:putative Holliday junction resolvase